MRRKVRVVAVIVVLTVIGIALISLVQWKVWDGAFPQTEFEITFIDEANNPIHDVRLVVLDSEGNDSPFYPVTDYHPGHSISSDSHGKMVFHHVTSGVEFGGKCGSLFFLFPIGDCDPPTFSCQFVLGDELVGMFRYYGDPGDSLLAPEMLRNWEDLPRVEKRWQWPEQLLTDEFRYRRGLSDRRSTETLTFTVVKRTIVLDRSNPGEK